MKIIFFLECIILEFISSNVFYLQEVIQMQKEQKELLIYVEIKINNIHFILMVLLGTVGVHKIEIITE